MIGVASDSGLRPPWIRGEDSVMTVSKGRRLAFLTGLLAMAVVGVTVYLGWPRILFWWRFEALGRNAEGHSEFRDRRTGMVLIRLPSRDFIVKEKPDSNCYLPNPLKRDRPFQVAPGTIPISRFLRALCDSIEIPILVHSDISQISLKIAVPMYFADQDQLIKLLDQKGIRSYRDRLPSGLEVMKLESIQRAGPEPPETVR